MIKFLSLLAVVLLPFSTLYGQQQDKIRYKTDRQQVIFTSDMNKESMEVLRKDLKNHAIVLHYVHTTFSPSGGLLALTFTVKDSSGRTYEASVDELPKDGFFGFEFAFVDGKSSVLNVGTLAAGD